MPYHVINQESCFINPICVDTGSLDCKLTVSSMKLAVRLARSLQEGSQCLVILVSDDRVVFEAAFELIRRTPLLGFKAPPHILSTGILTAYVVLAGSDGRITEIVDSGQLLVFPPDAAAEVRNLFSKITRDVQQFFRVGEEQQPQQQGSKPLFTRLWTAVSSLLQGSSWDTAGQLQAAQTAERLTSNADNSRPDPATLYAYEHFLVPFLRHWAAVLKPMPGPLQTGSVADLGKVDLLAVRLLHFLVNNEMWAGTVLLLGKFPSVAQHVLEDGLEMPGDFCDPIILERLRAALPPFCQQRLPGSPARQPQQQHDPYMLLQLRARYHMTNSQELNFPSGPTSSSSSSSYESASEILRRLGSAQQQQTEQQALETLQLARLEHAGQLDSAALADGVEGYLQMPASVARRGWRAGTTSSSNAATQGSVGQPLQAPVPAQSASHTTVPGQTVAPAREGAESTAAVPTGAGAGVRADGSGPAHATDSQDATTATPEHFFGDAPQAGSDGDSPRTGLLPLLAGSLANEPLVLAAAARLASFGGVLQRTTSSLDGSSSSPVLATSSSKHINNNILPANNSLQLNSSTTNQVPGSKQDHQSAKSTNVHQVSALGGIQMPALIKSAVTGFSDSSLESSYIIYKAHRCDALDTTTALVMSSTLLTLAICSYDAADMQHGLQQPLVVLAVWALFTLPYMVLVVRRRLFMQHRELWLVLGRLLSSVILVLVALAVLPQPTIWVNAAANTLVHVLAMGLVIPFGQQVRLPAAAAIAAVQLPADAWLLAMAMPVCGAALLSFVTHLLSLLVTVGLDAWCRHQFLQMAYRTFHLPQSSQGASADRSKVYSAAPADSLAGGATQHPAVATGVNAFLRQGWLGNSTSGTINQQGCSHPGQSAIAEGHGSRSSSTVAGKGWQQAVDLCKVAVTGFTERPLEASYAVYKSHTSSLLDNTAAIVTSGMSLAAAIRSYDPADGSSAWLKLAIAVVVWLLFVSPYIVMHVHRHLYLRFRELWIALGRITCATLVMPVALGFWPQPATWVTTVAKGVICQLNHAVILPCCQQVRLHAAIAIAAVQLPSDALVLAMGMPLRIALLHSFLVQVCYLLVTVAMDVWCRYRFMQAYPGAFGMRHSSTVSQSIVVERSKRKTS